MGLLFLLLFSCGKDADPCAGRADDADCDGVPDALDQCPDSVRGELKDPVGCTENQTAGCAVTVLDPVDHAVVEGEVLFRWDGTCDAYLLQFANDERFPAAATRTAARTTAKETAASGDERFFRIVGGRTGASTGATSEIRELEWKN